MRCANATSLKSDCPLTFLNFLRPRTLDERENSPDLIVRKGTAKSRHVALVTCWRVWLEAVFNNAEKLIICVVPGMTALIMRRRRQSSAWLALHPIRLTFQTLAVAAGT